MTLVSHDSCRGSIRTACATLPQATAKPQKHATASYPVACRQTPIGSDGKHTSLRRRTAPQGTVILDD